MSRIKEAAKAIQKNLSLEDYASKPVQQEDSKPSKQQYSKKKMTFYLTKDSESKFNEVFARRLMRNEKIDKSALIAEAIEQLYLSEKKYQI